MRTRTDAVLSNAYRRRTPVLQSLVIVFATVFAIVASDADAKYPRFALWNTNAEGIPWQDSADEACVTYTARTRATYTHKEPYVVDRYGVANWTCWAILPGTTVSQPYIHAWRAWFCTRTGGNFTSDYYDLVCPGDPPADVAPPQMDKATGPCGESTPCQQQTPRPINLGSGNKLLREQDYTAAGVFPLELTRYYNAFHANPRVGGFGTPWTHTYERFIAANGPEP